MGKRTPTEVAAGRIMDLLRDAFVEQGVTLLPGKSSLERMNGYLPNLRQKASTF